jgi:hypothetical protein
MSYTKAMQLEYGNDFDAMPQNHSVIVVTKTKTKMVRSEQTANGGRFVKVNVPYNVQCEYCGDEIKMGLSCFVEVELDVLKDSQKEALMRDLGLLNTTDGSSDWYLLDTANSIFCSRNCAVENGTLLQ